MRSLVVIVFSLINLSVAQYISFVNPPSAGPNSVYNEDPSYLYGSQIVIQWTPTNQSISITLWQQQLQDPISPYFEYIFQNIQGISKIPWVVHTNKSLDISRVFFFELFVTGQGTSSALSHYFNITGDRNPSSSSKASLPASTTPSAAANSKSSVASTTTSPPVRHTSATPTSTSNNSGLSTDAKIGIGVGVPVAVIIGVVAGWFFFGRRRKGRDTTQPGYSHYREAHHAPSEWGQSHRTQSDFGSSPFGASPSFQGLRSMQSYQTSSIPTEEYKEMSNIQSPIELGNTPSRF